MTNPAPGRWALALAVLLLLAAGCSGASREALPVIPLSLAGHPLQVEVAASPESLQTGLMHRRELPESQGMLFVFPQIGRHCMWMENTHIPLSVAFIDAGGRIINITDMTPLSRQIHCAQQPALYALEVNQGWFGGRGIGPGVTVTGLPES